MIIILTISILISYIFLSVIKYKIAKKSKETWDLEEYKIKIVFSFVFLTMLLIPFLTILNEDIEKYNKYYFKEKNEAKILILDNNIFSGTIVKWWTKDYPKIK